MSDVLQLVLRGAHDTIPNVRFTAVRALQEMAPHLDAGAVDSQVGVETSRNDFSHFTPPQGPASLALQLQASAFFESSKAVTLFALFAFFSVKTLY